MRVKRNKKLHKKRTVKQKNPKVLKKFALALAIVLVATFVYARYLQPYTLEAKQVLKLQSTQQKLNTTLKQLEHTKATDVNAQKQKDDQIKKLQQQIQDQKKQLEAKAARKAAIAYAAEKPVYSVPANGYKAFIYDHESGNDPGAINAGSGACGLGQALPCSKLPCSLSDYACQDNYFTNYAITRYGSWQNAYYWWINHHWW